ncbi:hypothetical protein NLU13_2803 [Sarocladium strictum]|uniref:Zn(2)-C6 fungal-type domain-containing protein n=1 Tax=Sarocladium strictum TaxID=5046 RepID=A0AA39GKT9_SARSR|nr:hypothetical protein NLU13_2803 [Sarocladium strictum]
MASTSSQGPSPHLSPYDFDSNGDTDESWQYLDFDFSSGSSAPASVGFLPSPGSGSLEGYAIVGHMSTPSQASAASPIAPAGDVDQNGLFSPSDVMLPSSMQDSSANAFVPSTSMPLGWTQDLPFLTPQAFLFSAEDSNPIPQYDVNSMNTMMGDFQHEIFSSPSTLNHASCQTHEEVIPEAMSQFTMSSFQFQAEPSWNLPTSSRLAGDASIEGLTTSPTPIKAMSSSPEFPPAKPDITSKSPPRSRKVVADKVDKRKKKDAMAGNFVIVTPTSISAQSGKPNPYDCFEHMRATQKGRKGPLASATKKNALQVRRLGACFCCHSRKVKCDMERPCRNCTKLAGAVPQVMCWQFQDFLTVLFPDFLRSHLKKEEVVKFIGNSVDEFRVGGVAHPCEVELYSGPTFSATLTVNASFFTAKTAEVLQHWHVMGGSDRVDLMANGSAPIGVDLSQSASRDELRKRTKAYVQQLIREPNFATQVTDNLRSTSLPRIVLGLVQRFSEQTDSVIVKRALSIYAMHYVITRHLCITQESVFALQPTGLIPQDALWVTPRVLARQIKAIVDEHMQREMQHVFDLFSKSLKPKHRTEWAPCLAAFLVLCLFMEAVETATDSFVVMENEVNLRNGDPPKYKRSFALDICKEVENLPFKQFAYQFHNIYQTHSKDANTRSFNPLFDNSFVDQGELDRPATELVAGLKELYYGECWQDMQFLSDDDLVISREEHPFPRDPSLVYTGRLLAKFLLSFTNEKAIFGGRI